MTKTSTRVSFGLYALELKADASLAYSAAAQPFARLADLETGNVSTRPYASYEPDYWLLDGQYKFLPPVYTTVHVGLMSLAMSGATGNFATPPVLTVTFSADHDTDSLALRFSTYTGDWAASLKVEYFNAADALIQSDTYLVSGPEFSTGQAVTGFRRIAVTFYNTNRPYRFLRVTAIDYGELISFEGGDIQAAEVVEQVNQLSSELPYGTLDLHLFSREAQFSILNPEGQYAALKERQPLDVYETVDGVSNFIGRYYLTEWENLSDTSYRFSAVDILGVLDGMTYHGGLWSGIALGELLESILTPIYVPYELDYRLEDVPVRGWLPACSYRESLQQIGFVVGAAVHATRAGVLQIQQSKIAADETAYQAITKAEKGAEQSLSLKPIVTGVEVTAHNYIPGGESVLVMSGEYDPGTYEVLFAEPMHALSITGGTILESGVNYAVIAVARAGTVALSGLKYIDTTAITAITMAGTSTGTRPNVLKVEKAGLVHSGNVGAVAQRLYDYHQQRYLQKVRLFAPSVQPGEAVLIDTLYSRRLKAVIEKMETNLIGFVVRAEMTGVDDGVD